MEEKGLKAEITIRTVDQGKLKDEHVKRHFVLGVLNSKNDIDQKIFEMMEKYTSDIEKINLNKESIRITVVDYSKNLSFKEKKIFIGFCYESHLRFQKEKESLESAEQEVQSIVEKNAKEIIGGLQDILNSIYP